MVLEQETTRKDQQSVEERREKIYEMHLKGSGESEIASAVGVNQSTVSRSLEVMSERNRTWFKQHWDHGSLQGSIIKEQRDRLMGLIREAWTLYSMIDKTDLGKKIQALSLVKNTVKDLGEMLGLQLPTLSDTNNFGPFFRNMDRKTETVKIDLSQEKVNRPRFGLGSALPSGSLADSKHPKGSP